MKRLACTALVACTHLASAQFPANSSVALQFAPGIVSTGKEFTTTFTPDGQTVLFTRNDSLTRRNHIYASHFANGAWQPATMLAISGNDWADLDPAISPDGKRLYYVSTRPHQGQASLTDMDLWVAESDGTDWRNPRWISELSSAGKEGAPTIDSHGTLCFFSDRDAAANANSIYCSATTTAGFAPPVRLNANVNAGPSDTSPFLTPDGTTLFFYSTREGGAGKADLYVSTKTNGDWGVAVNLGPAVNTTAFEYNPMVTRDGRTLIFGRDRMIMFIPVASLGIPFLTAESLR